jgi:glycosyltransferase involved in cell wall biosynthesis
MTLRKRIQILSSHYLPENTAATERIFALAKTLSKTYDVEILCLTQKGVGIPKISPFPEIQTTWIHQGNFNGSIFFIRVIFEFWYSLKLVWKARDSRADLRVVSIPYMFLLPLALLLLNKTPIIADVRDLVWEYLGEQTSLQRILKKLASSLMIGALRRCKMVVVTNPTEELVLSQVYGLSRPWLVSNGISQSRFDAVKDLHPVPASDKFVVMVCGNIGRALDLKVLLEAVEGVTGLEVLVVGGGSELQKMQNFARARSMENIVFTGPVPFESLSAYYRRSNLLFLQVHENYSSSRPVRIYEYLATGLPILIASEGETQEFASTFENMTVVAPGNARLLRKTLLELTQLPLAPSFENSRQIEERYLRDQLSPAYEVLISEILREHSTQALLTDLG